MQDKCLLGILSAAVADRVAVMLVVVSVLHVSCPGRIQDNKMIWQPLYQHPPTLLKALGEDRPPSHKSLVLRRPVRSRV